MGKNSVKFTIMGQQYSILTEGSPGEAKALASKVSQDIRDFMDANPRASVTMAAVLVAMGYLDEKGKGDAGTDNLRAQVKEYSSDARKLRGELDESKKQIKRLNDEIFALRGAKKKQEK